jgi:hypothetical protein
MKIVIFIKTQNNHKIMIRFLIFQIGNINKLNLFLKDFFFLKKKKIILNYKR